MKNLKNKVAIFFLIAISLSVTFSANAQLRKKTTAPLPQGQFIDLGVSPKDTLAVSDTIAYIIPMDHTNTINLYQTFYWTKIGSGTATMDAKFFQSNNGTDWVAVKQGVAQSAYSKTFTLSASGGANEIDFRADTALVSGRYLKIQYKTSSTASVQGSIATRLKSYWQ